MKNIKRATAIYTGGNQYEYIAELEDGTWYYGGDVWFVNVDMNPFEDYENCSYVEWIEKHLIEYVNEDDYQETLNKVICTIVNGYVLDQHNYDLYELIERIKPIEKKRGYRIVKLYGGMTGEYEVIKTNAPDSVIKANIVYDRNMTEQEMKENDKLYSVILAMGYIVECLGCQGDFDEKEMKYDAKFDWYEKF
jgi:hypothetical protein